MSTPKNNFQGDLLIYVCGEANLNTPGGPSLRDIVIRNLVTTWAIRTHPVTDFLDPRQENSAELFQIIPCASVFVFIFSKKTLEDSYFLNQYGLAKSYKIPVVGMRLTNYFIRNSLPEQYYRTEIVDNSGESVLDSKRTAEKTASSLAEHLIADFRHSMVYGPDFHKSCIERLVHKVTRACAQRENEKAFLQRSNENASMVNKQRQDKTNSPTKCPKCGFIFTNVSPPPKLQRASSTGSLLRRSNTYDHLPFGTSSAKTTVPRNRTPLQPATIQIPIPQVVKKPKKAEILHHGNWTTKPDNNKVPPQMEPKIQLRASSVSSSESAREETKPSPPPPKPAENPKVFRRQSRVSNGSWTEKLRNKLRRQSSLPVIPTTYLVTTPDGFEKQISLVRYPPEKQEPSSPRGSDGASGFSEDEDQETIHISRVPSPDAPSG
ncbi:hypothetical protein pdam_00009440 [Pocillopora damicornis]|uniref:TIR domain-containing protein n=1 Tax=Pocillopora damicornis TaxID=46731 RepID=A0A3M6TGD7_POCDA|nr:uncharacterized protein LOC113677985 [Pocillopora damicornis]XP_027050653.1 uncharacterized protein LOC113677985 [Pocillopora damicornis]RMX40456.1 hypothetical protein pdam_00009440 [Pocillopora damicornis]